MRSTLQAEVDQFPWHHQIDFGNGVMSNGKSKINFLRAQADQYFSGDLLKDRTFLDIGCWDGFNSFEASRRGASRVLATDHFAWSDRCWGNRGAFELARQHLAPSVEVEDIDLPELTVSRIGPFDVVLFAGVFYHLRHPFAALEQMAPIAAECLIVETHLDALDIPTPAMIFYPTTELANDDTNWWGPNPQCIEAMLRDVGFPRIETKLHSVHQNRGIFRAFRR